MLLVKGLMVSIERERAAVQPVSPGENLEGTLVTKVCCRIGKEYLYRLVLQSRAWCYAFSV